MRPIDQTENTTTGTPIRSSSATLCATLTQTRVRGKALCVPSAQIDGRTVIITGGWLKTAAVRDEELVEAETLVDPESFISKLKQTGLKADLFTFAQKLSETTPKYTYHLVWDNLAVIPITTFSHWWERQAEGSVRTAVRKAAKTGVVVKLAELDDSFVAGIVGINNETPIRQGKRFWHFQKDFNTVKLENATYPERTIFLGAYCDDELIGFMRITFVDRVSNIIQLLTKKKHSDKNPANALIAEAVKICEQRGISYLVYANYIYGDPNSSLTKFKRRNGFAPVLVPRYYISLTRKGRLALHLRLHYGLADLIPKPLIHQLLKIRSLWYTRRSHTAKDT